MDHESMEVEAGFQSGYRLQVEVGRHLLEHGCGLLWHLN